MTLTSSTVTKTIYYVFLGLLALGFLYPLLWMVATSFKTGPEALSSPLNLIPGHPTVASYDQAIHLLPRFLYNSVKLAFLNVTGLLIVASLAGYAFARLPFLGRNVIFLAVLATALIPHIVYLIPQYVVFKNYGWVDTHYPLWVPRAMTPIFGTFLMRQFFLTLPAELEDAARVDGASTFTIYLRIMLPLAKPALAAVSVFTFVDSWNDLLGPLIFINSTRLQTLPVALALFQGEFFTNTAGLMAAATITIIPVLLVFLLAQKYFVQGISLTGMRD